MENLKSSNDEIPEVLMQQYLTVKQFGDLFGITKSGVYSMIYRGRLKSTKFGSMTLVHRKEVPKFRPVMKDRLVRLERRKKEDLPDELEEEITE